MCGSRSAICFFENSNQNLRRRASKLRFRLVTESFSQSCITCLRQHRCFHHGVSLPLGGKRCLLHLHIHCNMAGSNNRKRGAKAVVTGSGKARGGDCRLVEKRSTRGEPPTLLLPRRWPRRKKEYYEGQEPSSNSFN